MRIKKAILVVQLALASFLSLPALNAAELVDQSGNLFAFQQKLAAKGNVQAQYTVGFMYETGYGVSADRAEAKAWYQQAADKGSIPASNRLTYLEIQEKGFDAKNDKAWLSEVKSEAYASKPEALFLLGQLYHEGIGVKKDLKKSLEIMYSLGTEGLVAADGEIERIEAEIVAGKYRKKKKRELAAKTALEKKSRQPRTVAHDSRLTGLTETNEQVEETAAVTPAVTAKAEDEARALKRKKYEAVMQQLAREQAEIDKLQGWAEGREVASVDDEI